MNQFLALLGFDPAKHSVKVEMMAGLTTSSRCHTSSP